MSQQSIRGGEEFEGVISGIRDDGTYYVQSAIKRLTSPKGIKEFISTRTAADYLEGDQVRCYFIHGPRTPTVKILRFSDKLLRLGRKLKGTVYAGPDYRGCYSIRFDDNSDTDKNLRVNNWKTLPSADYRLSDRLVEHTQVTVEIVEYEGRRCGKIIEIRGVVSAEMRKETMLLVSSQASNCILTTSYRTRFLEQRTDSFM